MEDENYREVDFGLLQANLFWNEITRSRKSCLFFVLQSNGLPDLGGVYTKEKQGFRWLKTGFTSQFLSELILRTLIPEVWEFSR